MIVRLVSPSVCLSTLKRLVSFFAQLYSVLHPSSPLADPALAATRLGLGKIEVIMFFCWGAYYAPFVFLGFACIHKWARISEKALSMWRAYRVGVCRYAY